MGNIFTRKALNDIMSNEGLSAEQRTEQVFALYGRALDDGYIAKAAAQQAQQTALESAKADWEKELKIPDPKESDAYKALAGEFADYKAMQTARASDEFKGVKPKFFEAVYGMIDRKDGAKPIAEQLTALKGEYEEYFADEPAGGNQGRNTPQYSKQPGRDGINPGSEEDKLFKQIMEGWK